MLIAPLHTHTHIHTCTGAHGSVYLARVEQQAGGHQHVAVKQVVVDGIGGGGCGVALPDGGFVVGSPLGAGGGGSGGGGGNDLMGAMAHEIALIRSLSHPHIVRYLGAHRCGGCLNIMLGAFCFWEGGGESN